MFLLMKIIRGEKKKILNEIWSFSVDMAWRRLHVWDGGELVPLKNGNTISRRKYFNFSDKSSIASHSPRSIVDRFAHDLIVLKHQRAYVTEFIDTWVGYCRWRGGEEEGKTFLLILSCKPHCPHANLKKSLYSIIKNWNLIASREKRNARRKGRCY